MSGKIEHSERSVSNHPQCNQRCAFEQLKGFSVSEVFNFSDSVDAGGENLAQ